MKINRNKFCLELATVLIIFVFGFVFSEGDLKKEQPCEATNGSSCVVVCRRWDVGSRNGLEGLKEVLRAEGKKHKTCELVFESCTLKPDRTHPWEGLNPNEEPKIDRLKIIHSEININELSLKIFQNVHHLTMENTTTDTLQPEVFNNFRHLRRLQLRKNGSLKKVRNGFLQNLTLDYLQIQRVDLNPSETFEFFKNLTSEREAPTVRELDWSRNNFGNFPKSLLAPFSNLKILNLTDCCISGFEDDVFSNGNFTRVFVDNNKIVQLSEKIFKPLLEKGAFVSFGGNLACGCEMEWMRRWVESKHIRIDCTVPEVDHLNVGTCSENLNNHKKPPKFTITDNNPECLEITLPGTTDPEKAFILYGDYKNSAFPYFNCFKTPNRKFQINVKPDVNYLICLTTVVKYFQIDISDCLPLKTNPHHEDQPWLTKKSIPLSIISIFVVFLFALATGALILYLSVRKNPSLIRGSKRVIEVKRHDKAQILIMPRGYEPVSQADGSPFALAAPSIPLAPSRSCDTISTVSYVSANQPTQLEILAYRFNRLRELFQRNTSFFIPDPMRGQMVTPISRRLPPNVDLLLEYEWYTITTTTTTQV